MDQELAFEHDHCFVAWMSVQRRDFTASHHGFKENKGAAGLLLRGLPGMNAAAVKPESLSFAILANNGYGRAG
jgi:hypothetical protein